MSKKIIVAGGGHGGIATAMLLAQRGFDVTVYEKNSRENMGYDWTDIFDRKGFSSIGLSLPEENLYRIKQDMTFYGPSYATALTQNVPEAEREIQMERKDIYKYIIAHAEKAGVKFQFECAVNKPIMFGNRVVGISTDKGEFYGDLTIDACGMNSPVRGSLPEHLGVQNSSIDYEQFYVYRAYFNKTAEVEKKDFFKLVLLPENELGISWVNTEKEHTDVLIGRFMPFTLEEANEKIAKMREKNPSIGTEIVRGGAFANIPVRQPLGILVADGYVAIGDSAFMTVPIIGSGIANCFKAAKILANAICDDKNGDYSAESLWKYQKDFYKKIGSAMAPLACVKLLLTRLEGEELDYIFATGILNAEDMTIGADDTSLGAMLSGVKLDDVKLKLKGLINNKAVLKKVIRMVVELGKATVITGAMPKIYNRKAVNAWAKQYNNCFKH